LVGTLKEIEKRSIVVDVVPHFARTIELLPPYLEITIESAKGKKIGQQRITFAVEFFLGTLHNYVPPAGRRKVNVLIFGKAGTGKTTLIKTILSMMKGRIVTGGGGQVGGGLNHASTTYREIKICPTISVWDPWGATANNYQGHELELMLSGSLPPNWEMDAKIKLHEPAIHARAGLRDNPDRIDAVFFTVSPLMANDLEYLKRINEWTQIVNHYDHRMCPFLLLTKIDEVNPDLRKNPDLNDQILSENLEKISAETGVPIINIFPMLGYIEEREVNFFVDKLSHVSLSKALNAIDDRYEFSF